MPEELPLLNSPTAEHLRRLEAAHSLLVARQSHLEASALTVQASLAQATQTVRTTSESFNQRLLDLQAQQADLMRLVAEFRNDLHS